VESRVVVASAKSPDDLDLNEVDTTPRWEDAGNRAALPLDAVEALFDSSSLRAAPEFVAYARPSFPAGRPLFDAVLDPTARIHADFTFEPILSFVVQERPGAGIAVALT
jgi:hypothetical protein